MLIGVDGNEANLTNNRVGINQYAFFLLHSLSELNTKHKFVVYLKNPPRSDMPKENNHFKYRVIPFPKLWTQTRLPFDLYTHFPRPNVFFSVGHYAPRFCPMPYVISIMDLGFLDDPSQFTKKDYNQLKSWTSYSVKSAKKVITISEFSKQHIVRAYGTNPSDISVTYPGFNAKQFKKTLKPDISKKYGISSPYIIFLSSLKPSKNVERLIQAFASLKHQYLHLVIAGKKGWQYDSIFNLVEKYKLSSKVHFTGFVPAEDVAPLISGSSAFVLPSLHEGFGIPVLEAMACEVPVVVSQVASLPEVAGNAGIYVDPYSTDSIAMGIRTALSSKRNKYIELGQSQVKKFSWARCAKQTLSVLESAV